MNVFSEPERLVNESLMAKNIKLLREKNNKYRLNNLKQEAGSVLDYEDLKYPDIKKKFEIFEKQFLKDRAVTEN